MQRRFKMDLVELERVGARTVEERRREALTSSGMRKSGRALRGAFRSNHCGEL